MRHLPSASSEPLWLRATTVLDRAYDVCCALREELALAFVPRRTWSAAVIERYHQRARFYSDERYEATGLFDWEAQAVAQWFPKPPACILVGAAGAGREALALARAGHGVAAFEPAPALFDALRSRVHTASSEALVAMAGFDDVVAAVEAPPEAHVPEPLRSVCRERAYGGIVLGFGSFSYCVDAASRTRLLRSVARLGPGAPVLVSFELDIPVSGRIARAARLVRACLRHCPGAHDVADGDRLGDMGFEHAYTRDELSALARAAGYDVAYFASEPTAHAVLLPIGERPSSAPSTASIAERSRRKRSR